MRISPTRALQALFLSLLAFFTLATAAAGYRAQGGRIYDPAGQEVQVRGISHFGFNAPILQPQFLWAMGWKEQIAQIKSLGFNAVRVPFVPDTLYATTTVDKLSYVDPNRNPEMLGKTPLQALDLWMAEANRQGLYVMLDFHSVSMQRQYPTWFVSNPADYGLVYNKQAYTKDNWMRDLAFVAQRYAHLPYFFAIDLYNEPNGSVRWSTGDPSVTDPAYHWKPAAEAAAAAVLAANPNLLIFVQGIAGNFDGIENSSIPVNWGEDFQPQAWQPLQIPLDKLVLSPHTYGPDVYPKTSFSAPNFPSNLAADWEALFGRFSSQHPVVIGEWGGKYGQGTGGTKDVTWQNALVDYLISKNMRSTFYWCYTPNSGDTGGILDDSLQVRQDKLLLLRRLWGGTTTTNPPPPQPSYPQPKISGFSPTSGPAGTVVTLRGSGFTGANAAAVGGLKTGAVTVASDSRLKFTVPAGAPSGTIGVFNPGFSAYSAGTFTVTGGGTVTVTAPAITSFSPATGPVGTVVTLNGRGFTGATTGSVGNARNVPLQVLSDSQLRLTVPSDATTGPVGVSGPAGSTTTASAYTVTTTVVTTVAPYIQSFSPAAGPVGTVVTIYGSGFTGATEAWVGNLHGVPVRVVSDTQLQLTVPSGATSGAIGVFNPAGVSFTATSFTVQ
jgi:aryl-phospho-beta-D-glucosidase BglC (GH1 family)